MQTIFDQLRRGATTSSAAETQALAAELARALSTDTTLALHGNLGAGKTTFLQGLARGLGITHSVTSPTFNIYTVHRSPASKSGDAALSHSTTLVHLDAYRLETARQIEELLVEDFLVTPWCLAIEWPEKVADWIPAGALHLDLGITSDKRHSVRLR